MSALMPCKISHILHLPSKATWLRRMTGPEGTLRRAFGHKYSGTFACFDALALRYPIFRHLGSTVIRRTLATPVKITPDKLSSQPPPETISPSPVSREDELRPLERYIYDRLQAVSKSASFSCIYREYKSNAGRVLDTQLLYESRPNATRRVEPLSRIPTTVDDGVILIAHVAVTKTEECHVNLSSGFALAVGRTGDPGQYVVTCCHTLEEVRLAKSLFRDLTKWCLDDANHISRVA